MNYNPLAESLNAELSANGCSVLGMLSEQGKAIFFPRKGILGQGAEAKGSDINATIGTALEDDGSPLVLDCVLKSLNLPKQSFLYAPSFGNPDLRKEWKAQVVRKNPTLASKNFSNPVVTAALTHAISCAGYLFLDNWMVLGVFDYQNNGSGEYVTTQIGAGVRYYFERNGIFVGLTPKYSHQPGIDEFKPEINVGYAFFLGHYATLEPELYYEQSFKGSKYSQFGLRLGFGVYF